MCFFVLIACCWHMLWTVELFYTIVEFFWGLWKCRMYHSLQCLNKLSEMTAHVCELTEVKSRMCTVQACTAASNFQLHRWFLVWLCSLSVTSLLHNYSRDASTWKSPRGRWRHQPDVSDLLPWVQTSTALPRFAFIGPPCGQNCPPRNKGPSLVSGRYT